MSQKSVNAIKVLGVDAINKAKSGHPGVVMGAAPMAYSLFANHLRVNPKKKIGLTEIDLYYLLVMVQCYYIHYYIFLDLKMFH